MRQQIVEFDDSIPHSAIINNDILRPYTVVDSSGILREAQTTVAPFVPDLVPEKIINPEELSSEEYQQYMQEVAKIAALQNPNITLTPEVAPPPPSVTAIEEVPQVQFMGMEEFIAISDEGIIIPQDSNLVVIPINEIKEPELFNVVVEAKIAEPEKPVYEIIMDEVVRPLAEIPRAEGETLAESADEIKNIILFQNDIVELKTENPGMTIVEATIIAAETGQPSTVAVEEVVKKVEEIVTMQEENGVTNNNDAQNKAREKLIKKVNELSFLDKIVNYIYKTIYAN